MYRILVIATLLLLNLPVVNSQVLELKPTTKTAKGKPSDFEIALEAQFINHTTKASNFKWVRRLSLPKGWDFGICDPKACYSGLDSVGNFDRDSITGGYFSFHFTPNNIADTGSVHFIVYNSLDSANTVITGDYIAIASNLDGIADKAGEKIKIYPYFAHSDLTVSYGTATVNRLEIHNVSGSLKKSAIIAQNCNQSTINISDLSKGIHIISLFDKNNQLILTKKFQKVD